MIRFTRFLKILLASLSLSLLAAGFAGTVGAAQENTKELQQRAPGEISGKVTEVINASGYTYAEIDTGKEKVWAAGPPTELKAGDMITISSQMPMQNFHSKSIGRTFPVIYFINSYDTGKAASTIKKVHPQLQQNKATEPVEGIKKAEGGNTIAEVYADKTGLKGKTVRVRGKVSKFSADIMGKNWLHIRDSSTLDDLTVTSADTAAVGDVVVVEGKLEQDKDYGYGYIYPVILENAKIIKQ